MGLLLTMWEQHNPVASQAPHKIGQAPDCNPENRNEAGVSPAFRP